MLCTSLKEPMPLSNMLSTACISAFLFKRFKCKRKAQPLLLPSWETPSFNCGTLHRWRGLLDLSKIGPSEWVAHGTVARPEVQLQLNYLGVSESHKTLWFTIIFRIKIAVLRYPFALDTTCKQSQQPTGSLACRRSEAWEALPAFSPPPVSAWLSLEKSAKREGSTDTDPAFPFSFPQDISSHVPYVHSQSNGLKVYETFWNWCYNKYGQQPKQTIGFHQIHLLSRWPFFSSFFLSSAGTAAASASFSARSRSKCRGICLIMIFPTFSVIYTDIIYIYYLLFIYLYIEREIR